MKRCKECNILVATERKTCPVCLSILVDDNTPYETEPYPVYQETSPQKHIVRKIFLYLSILAIGVCVLVNILTYPKSHILWSLIVVFGIIYLWVLVKYTIISKRNMAFRLFLQAFFLCFLMYFIEDIARNGSDQVGYWFFPYVMPFIMMATLLAIILIVCIKTMRYRDYMLYMFMIAFIGCIPIILAYVNPTKDLFIDNLSNHIVWPSIACAALSAATILGMIIFGDKETKDEFKKRFHV